MSTQTAVRTTVTTGEIDRRFTRGDLREQVSVRLTRSLRRDIDALAARKGITRTALVEDAVRLYLAIASREDTNAAD